MSNTIFPDWVQVLITASVSKEKNVPSQQWQQCSIPASFTCFINRPRVHPMLVSVTITLGNWPCALVKALNPISLGARSLSTRSAWAQISTNYISFPFMFQCVTCLCSHSRKYVAKWLPMPQKNSFCRANLSHLILGGFCPTVDQLARQGCILHQEGSDHLDHKEQVSSRAGNETSEEDK